MWRPVIALAQICSEAIAMTTLLELKAIGLTHVMAVCLECQHRFNVQIAALQLPDETLMSDVRALHPMACPQCDAPSIVDLPKLTHRGQREGKP